MNANIIENMEERISVNVKHGEKITLKDSMLYKQNRIKKTKLQYTKNYVRDTILILNIRKEKIFIASFETGQVDAQIIRKILNI